ncbi:MAG: hypothetical protein RIN62_14455 [Lacrimispora sp.]|nr:hypothetical protein [Lacrimispora sp.]
MKTVIKIEIENSNWKPKLRTEMQKLKTEIQNLKTEILKNKRS